MKRFYLVVLAVMAIVSLGQVGCTYDKAKMLALGACDTIMPSFATDIRPIITLYCSDSNNGDCHDGSGTQGQPDFTNYAGIKEQVDNEELERQVFELGDMPDPDTQGPKQLTAEHLQLLLCWIEQGAPDN